MKMLLLGFEGPNFLVYCPVKKVWCGISGTVRRHMEAWCRVVPWNGMGRRGIKNFICAYTYFLISVIFPLKQDGASFFVYRI